MALIGMSISQLCSGGQATGWKNLVRLTYVNVIFIPISQHDEIGPGESEHHVSRCVHACVTESLL